MNDNVLLYHSQSGVASRRPAIRPTSKKPRRQSGIIVTPLMGYHAPQAEEVHRYLFRLDQSSQAKLSGGFSWSILFVNDNSSVCREFLARVGAELCYRIADRIRFVFFSA
jgi:hypothetical protein